MLDLSRPGEAGTPVYRFDAALPQRSEAARGDLLTGLRRWRLPAALAWLDLRNRYRGSVLGPFWMTLSTAAMVFGLGFLYSNLLKVPLAEYLPFVAISLILWNVINQIANDACTSLTSAEGIIRQMPLPYSVHILRCVFRNVLIAAHNLPLILLVFLVCGIWPRLEWLAALPGLALMTVNAFFVALFLGMLCARFRDIGPIVGSTMQLLFFLSPVLWKPELLGPRADWLLLNPAYTLMEVVRGPLLSGGTSLAVWLSALFFTVFAAVVALAFFVRFRGRIAFWV
jgi:lipopolysaccharide transport system permease protein